MIYDQTLCIEATRAGTGITATLLLAGQVGRAVWVDAALGATIGRAAKVVRLAGAHGLALLIAAIGKLTTR